MSDISLHILITEKLLNHSRDYQTGSNIEENIHMTGKTNKTERLSKDLRNYFTKMKAQKLIMQNTMEFEHIQSPYAYRTIKAL